ncbi:MAG: hypothetical protein NT076_04920, partial [Candidatus Pacearchaeota archaeon]|nr:hypothetical protein [Candidatus Pacearchaeota archaeon]
ENLDEVFYTYTDSRGALKEKRLCSKLNDGRCVKKVSFSLGQHDLTLNVIDKASNLIGWPVSFDVV